MACWPCYWARVIFENEKPRSLPGLFHNLRQINIMASENADEIKLKKGETTEIKLKGLATAGYEWNYMIEGNKAAISLTKEFVLPEKLTSKNMGTSADEIFTITAREAAVIYVTFFQKRGWEENTEPLNSRKIKIAIS